MSLSEMFAQPRRAWFLLNFDISLSTDRVPIHLTAAATSGTIVAKSAGGNGYPAAGTYFTPNPAVQADLDQAAGVFGILYEGHDTDATSVIIVNAVAEVAADRLSNWSAFSGAQQAEIAAGLLTHLVKIR